VPTLLVIDRDPAALEPMLQPLRDAGWSIPTAATVRRGLKALADCRPDAVLLDLQVPDVPGWEAFARLREGDPYLPVVVLSDSGTSEEVIAANCRGAFAFLVKPAPPDRLCDAVGRAAVAGAGRPAAAAEEDSSADAGGDLMVGDSPAMRGVYEALGRVGPRDVPVLLLGESGTGKELAARALHRHSRRARGPFRDVNCAAVAEGLLESALFGHERGAFTGAERKRLGLFEQAHGGTLFLDEVGDTTPALQAKLLRVLQERCFERVGGSETVRADVRVVAATNKDLEGLMRGGAFRQDLLYRLNGFTVRLPPLRERPGDVRLLVEHFLRRYRGELNPRVRGVAPEAWPLLERYAWPGNVRQLSNVVCHGLVEARADVLTADCLPEELRRPANGSHQAVASEGLDAFVRGLLAAGETEVYDKVIARAEQAALTETLRFLGGNQTRAAEVLGMSRTTLRGKLRRLRRARERGG
jgi:two-component system nitrogen regulation response regulator GlnG